MQILAILTRKLVSPAANGCHCLRAQKIHHLESDSVHKAGAKEQAQFLAFPRRKRFIPSRSPADIDLLDTSRRPSMAQKSGWLHSLCISFPGIVKQLLQKSLFIRSRLLLVPLHQYIYAAGHQLSFHPTARRRFSVGQAGEIWGRRRRGMRRRPTRRAPARAAPWQWRRAAPLPAPAATATRPNRSGRRLRTCSTRSWPRRRPPPQRSWRIRCTAQGSTWLGKQR